MEGESRTDYPFYKFDPKKADYYRVLVKLYHLWRNDDPGAVYRVEDIEPDSISMEPVIRYRNVLTGEQLKISGKDARQMDWLDLFARHKIDVKDFSILWDWDQPYSSLKKDILKNMLALENQLWNLLQMARCQGGTKGYKVGNRWEKVKEMRESLRLMT
jgi:hypothetical protein